MSVTDGVRGSRAPGSRGANPQVTGFFAFWARNLTFVVDIFSESWLTYLIAGTTGTDERIHTS